MQKQIIEINGVKLEVDLSEATVISSYKLGDRVKVLVKRYSSYESHAGVLVGFDRFEKLPTLIVAYVDSGQIKFLNYNAQSEGVEICPMNEKDMPFEKARVLELMNREITKAEEQLSDLRRRKEFFLAEFGKYFEHEVGTGTGGETLHVN